MIYADNKFAWAVMQNDMDKLCGWAREWLFRYNIAKCKHLKQGTNDSPNELILYE